MAENMQAELLWEKILEAAENSDIPKLSFATFIKPLTPLSLSGRKIVLEAHGDTIVETIARRGEEGLGLSAKLRAAIVKADVGVTDFALALDGKVVYNADLQGAVKASEFEAIPLNPNFTFESFVVGPSNKLVYSAAKMVAASPATDGCNPLTIYGGTGLGKTHLVQAIANDILSRKPTFRVVYTTLEKFLNEFTKSLAPAGNKLSTTDRRSKFREHYRSVDILIIDDIQFLAGKPGVQEEFFHTFNDLYAQNKQIVLTSDVNPDKISTLEDRLRTRFKGGLIWEVNPPDEHTKIEILRRKAYEKRANIPDEVLSFLAVDSGSDVRTLEGRVNKVILASKLYEQEISLELAALALDKSVPEREDQDSITAENVLNCVCQYYKVKKEAVLGANRKAELVKARQIACFLMYEILNLPLVTIGKIMNRDHTTVIYSKKQIAGLISKNPIIAKDVDDIKNTILKK